MHSMYLSVLKVTVNEKVELGSRGMKVGGWGWGMGVEGTGEEKMREDLALLEVLREVSLCE